MSGGNGMTEHQNDRNEDMLTRLEREQEFEHDRAWAILDEQGEP
jgi:hypothetical protein